MNDQKTEQPEAAKVPVDIDELKLQTLMQEIKDNQNLSLGILGGMGAAAIGAIIWAVITALTNFQIGWMAVGLGFLVGIGVRSLGKGINTSFGIVGAILSLVGCLAGNLLTVCILISRQEGIELFNLLTRLNPAVVVELIKATFNPMDLLFYGIAVYEGYRFSFRRVSDDELSKLTK
ncbi:MAG: hypothetical protein JSV83_16775 [Desulfobacterales bacterium]|nr:MAG: hypothetical protein JSV83_16775 [Desulfobacterales bacterium]